MRIKPFLKWAGNKYRCLDKILPHLPKSQRLIEPFAGSGSIFINSDYKKYLLAEANKDVISLFSILQKDGLDFIHCCQKLFTPENNSAQVFYMLRDKFNQSTDMYERAILFLYLNKHGFNGLCRYNNQGIYNVPFGSFKKPYFPLKEMQIFAEKAKNATFVHQDFTKTFTLLKPGDTVYCDPPYTPLKPKQTFDYIKPGFGINEHVLLKDLAIVAANNGITVLISNHDTQYTRELYKESKIIAFKVKRSISCKAQQRSYVNELLAIFTP